MENAISAATTQFEIIILKKRMVNYYQVGLKFSPEPQLNEQDLYHFCYIN